MTGRAAVDDVHLGQPDLLDAGLEVTAQSHGVTTLADEVFVAALVATPVGKKIFRGSDRQQDQQQQARPTKRTDGIAEEFLAKFFETVGELH